MKKEFVFSTKFDTAEFDKSIQQMQQKLKEIYAPADMLKMQSMTNQRMQGAGGGSPGQSNDAYQRATQQGVRQINQLLSEQARIQENLGKTIIKREQSLKSLRDQQKQMVKDSSEELAIKQKISQVEQNQNQMREQYKQRDMAMNQAMDARESMKPQGMDRLSQAYRGGGIGGAARAGFRMAGGAAGMAGGLAGIVGSAIPFMPEIYRDYGRMPINTASNTGSAINQTLGRDVGAAYSGRQGMEMAFMPERMRALGMANQATNASRRADIGNLFAPVASGALIGAAGGSVIPGAGTAIGAGVGALGGLGKMGYNLMTDEKQRSLAMSPFSDKYKANYESMKAKEFAQNFTEALDSIKDQNPLKKMAAEEYNQNFMRNLQTQRGLGINDEQLYGQGGMMRGGINAGFTSDMTMQSANGILGAGGSSRSAFGNATFGNQMARGMNLTNSSSILGSLSGGMGSGEATKEATIRILAQGMKLGLDDSKFAEEQRRFAQATADIISRSGAASGSDADRVAGGFGKFVGETTNKGIEAAKSAYEEYQQISSSTTGARGVMRAAGFLSDKNLGRLSTMTRQALMQVPEAELNENNPLVKAAAREAGVPVEEIVKSVTGTNQGAVSRFSEADKIRDRVRAGMKKAGISQLNEENMKNLPANVQADLDKLSTFQVTELGYKGQRETNARLMGTVNQAQGTTNTEQNLINDRLGRDTGRAGDETVKGAAESSRMVLDNFVKFKNELVPTADAIAKFNEKLKQTVETINKMSDVDKASQFQKLNTAIYGTQPQAGKAGK